MSLLMYPVQVEALAEAVKELKDCEGHEPDDMVHINDRDGGIVQVSLTSISESRFITEDGKVFTTRGDAHDAEDNKSQR